MSSLAPAPANTAPTPIRRALLSVSDKSGILDFARALVACGVELLSTGGTQTTDRPLLVGDRDCIVFGANRGAKRVHRPLVLETRKHGVSGRNAEARG